MKQRTRPVRYALANTSRRRLSHVAFVDGAAQSGGQKWRSALSGIHVDARSKVDANIEDGVTGHG